MEWCKPEKRRLDNNEEPSLLQGCEKRRDAGFRTSEANSSFMMPMAMDSLNQPPTSLALFSSKAAVIPATHHFSSPLLNQTVGVSSYGMMQHQELQQQAMTSQAAGESLNTDCSMDVVEARTSGPAPHSLMSSCSSSSSTTQSPMLNSPAPTDFGQGPRFASPAAPCPRCLAGEGGHFKHVISERHEHHPWYF
ncbi:uncharacterized protein LOC135817425 isoform X2 [Sycon ciliatum]|uniref:uncharacterized protein LOC135817425 isoform X2 n=1 Tax=Sycon ciliatum TaxID=27933 RepID=UPI0020AC3024|eukprot:scpid15999/ scgid16669/ 